MTWNTARTQHPCHHLDSKVTKFVAGGAKHVQQRGTTKPKFAQGADRSAIQAVCFIVLLAGADRGM